MSPAATSNLTPMERDANDKLQVHLMGFMGCGKTTVGLLLARRLVWNFLDLDALIERHTGRAIASIFAEDGEERFRQTETFVLRQATQKPHTVVALGGGAPVATENRELSARTATSVWLRCDFAELQRRIGSDQTGERDSRPLWADTDAVRSLFEQRQPIYAEADLTVDAAASPEEVAANIETLLRP